MILQNLSNALRQQNWFAVVLELVIVIAGIVMGFQISAWAADRQLRVEERAFVDRLQADLEALRPERANIARMTARNRTLNAGVLEKLSPDSSATGFDPDECAFMIVSNLINYDPTDLPTLEELSSSGDRQFIRDPELNAAISTFVQGRQARSDIARELSSKTVDLSLRHSDLIRQRISIPQNGLSPENLRAARLSEIRQTECDLAAMRTDGEFLNNVANNTVMLALYVEAVTERTDHSLTALTNALAAFQAGSSD